MNRVAVARALSKLGGDPETIIILEVPDSVITERITGRRSDPVTNKIYHLQFNPPPNEEIRSRLTQRPDDSIEKIGNRLMHYYNNIKSILGFYTRVSNPPRIINIDGNRTPNQVFQDIGKAINK